LTLQNSLEKRHGILLESTIMQAYKCYLIISPTTFNMSLAKKGSEVCGSICRCYLHGTRQKGKFGWSFWTWIVWTKAKYLSKLLLLLFCGV